MIAILILFWFPYYCLLPYFHFKKVARLFIVSWNRGFFRARSFWWKPKLLEVVMFCASEKKEERRPYLSGSERKKLFQLGRRWRLSVPTNMRKPLKGEGLMADLLYNLRFHHIRNGVSCKLGGKSHLRLKGKKEKKKGSQLSWERQASEGKGIG